MSEPVTLETFAPCVGSTFTLPAGQSTVTLTLVAADALPATPGGHGRPPFSLEFLGPADPTYAQATLPLTHPVIGIHEIFVVPIARDAAGTRYQAIFS